MSEPVRVAAVGLGGWAEVLAAAYARSPRLRLVTCYSRSAAGRERFAARFGCAEAESLDAVLARPDVEALIVTVPNDRHAEVVEQAARAGKHVFVDKPLAVTLADCRRIERVVRETGITFLCGHSARRLGGVRRIKELIDSGELGKISSLELSYSNPRGTEITAANWRADPEQTPGGSLTQIGIHQIDNLQYLAGPVVRVFNRGKAMHTRAATDTVTQAVLECEGGQLAYLGTNWVSPGSFQIRVFGTQACLTYTLDLRWWSQSGEADQHSRLVRIDAAGESEVAIPSGDYLRDQMEEFAAALRGGPAPAVDATAALRNVAVVLAAVRSAAEGRMVDIREILD